MLMIICLGLFIYSFIVSYNTGDISYCSTYGSNENEQKSAECS